MTGTNATRDPDSVLAAWLDEGPTGLPDATRRAILAALPTTPQSRRGIPAPWRFPHMNMFARGASLLIVGVVAIAGLAFLVGSRGGVGGPGPSPSPSPSAATVDPCLVGTWTTDPLSGHSPADAEATFSGGAGEIFTIDAQGNVTIDTHAAQKIVFVAAGGETFTATPTGTGHGTLWTITSGDTHLFQYHPSGDTTLSTEVVDSTGTALGPSKPDLPFSAIYTCTPGQSLTFYNATPTNYMIDAALVTLTAGIGSSAPEASPSAP
jgi:hypothetical protein